MLTVLCIIFLVLGISLIIIGSKIYDKGMSYEDKGDFIMCIGTIFAFALIITFVPLCTNLYELSRLSIYDNKIQMYQEENNKIQNQVSEIVQNYMKYEQDTYSKAIETIDWNNTDIIVLTQMYPNLKSNELVNTQINIYQENNTKMKELKEQKFDAQIAKWWVYFGSAESEA